MADPLLFAIGVLVTGMVALAVWSVGMMDPEEPPLPDPDARDPRSGEDR